MEGMSSTPEQHLSARRTSHAGGSALLTAVLVVGVVLTAVSMVALVWLLAAYFAGAPSHAALYGLSLFGMPTGFALLLLYVVLSAVRRSRL
jgi:uncharacterized membrane-anchored protein